jgi:hypothetical protein
VASPAVDLLGHLSLIGSETKHRGIGCGKETARQNTKERLGALVERSNFATRHISLSTLKRAVLLNRESSKHLASTADRRVRNDQPALSLLVLSASSSKTMDI